MSVTGRYILRQWWGIFTPLMISFVGLYLIIDFLDRLDVFLRHDASWSTTLRYFAFKVPLIVTQTLPAAALVATLVGFGLLARHNEITAWRASGVSLWQTARPVLATGFLLSLAAVAWNESVVPYATRQFEHVNRVEVRKRGQQSILADRHIWYYGRSGFYNIDHIDAQRESLYGLTIYRVSEQFQITSIVDIREATWEGSWWYTQGAIEHSIDAGGGVSTQRLTDGTVRLEETIDDFLEIRRDPEELSFFELRARILDLAEKGIDASHYLVDLHLKLSLPFAVLLMIWIGVPIAGGVRRNPSVPQTLAVGLVIGFSYWMVLGFARSLGATGIIEPIAAAWSANALMGLAGMALFLRSE